MRGLSFLLLFSFFLSSCTPQASPSLSNTALYIYRFEPPAFLEFSDGFQQTDEIPFSIPPHCGLFNVSPAPLGPYLAVELSCPNGQTILFLDLSTQAVKQPVLDSDSHFLAWTPDGRAAYLKIDSLGSPRVVRVFTDGEQDLIPIPEFTYDLAASSTGDTFLFTFSRGLGQGSELWLAERNGKTTALLYADPFHYLSFARYSPDAGQIAFVKIPDSQTPFSVGELWVMNADGSNARKLAEADAGHGYAANWSPDGRRVAFVKRENPDDERADQASEALISNIQIVDAQTGAVTQLTHFEHGYAETPFWSPDGNTLAFNVVLNDRMEVHLADIKTGEARSLLTELSCCPAWIQQ